MCLMLHQPSQRRVQLALGIARRTTDAGVGDADTDTQLHVETLWPVGREFGIDRGDETGEELVCRLRVSHRQHDSVAGLLPQSAPVHQQRRLADRPLAQQRGVLWLTLARPGDPRLEDGRLALAPSQQRREDPAARSEWVRRSRL